MKSGVFARVSDDAVIWHQVGVASHPGASLLKDLGFLRGFDDDAIRRVVEFPGNYTQKFCLVLIAVVVGGADTDELLKLPTVRHG